MFEKNRFWIDNEGQKAIGLSANGRSDLIDELDAAEKRIAELTEAVAKLDKYPFSSIVDLTRRNDKLEKENDFLARHSNKINNENVQLKKDLQVLREREFEQIAHNRAVVKLEKIKEILE